MNDHIIRRVVSFFLLISVILVVVAIGAVRNINRSVVTGDWVNHTHAVILESEALLTELYAGDAAVRTFLLMGEARDRTAARQAFARMQEHMEVLRALVRGESGPRDDIAGLARLVADRADLAADLATRRSSQAERPAALLEADMSAGMTDEIQRRVDRLRERQMALLAERDTASYLQAQSTRWAVWAGVALDVVLLAGVAWLVRDDIGARRRAAAALETANRDLDARVRERTGELAAANERLLTENLERQWTNQALEHQLRYDQLIISSINDLVLVLTKVMNISRINPAVIQASGFGTPDLVNKPLHSILEMRPERPGSPASQADALAQALKAGREVRGAGLLRRKGGGRIPVRVTMFPLRDGDKVVGGVVILEVVPTAADAS